MPALATPVDSPATGIPNSRSRTVPAPFGVRAEVHPNALVRWTFYLSIFTIPFSYLYVPGTGGHVGVVRIVQALMLFAIFSQPRVCLRLVPTALFWFLGYITVRIIWGLWLAPDMARLWWPSSREFIEYLPWFWVMFNVLQYRETRRGGLWALGLGFSVCAACHIAGIGVTEVNNGFGNRTTVFGMNANELGGSYAAAMIALLGLWMHVPRTLMQRLLPLPLMAFMGVAMAETGSRTAIVVFLMGTFILFFMGKSYESRLKRVASLILCVAVLASILWQIPTVMERFAELNIHDIGQHNPRARMAPVLWDMFLQSPVFGLGPDNYDFKLTREAMPYLIDQGQLIESHNLALLLLVETGIIGFLLYTMGFRMPLVTAWKARLKSGPLPLALLLPFAIIALTISNPIHDMTLWVAMAYGLVGAV